MFLSESYTGTSGVKYRTRVLVTVDGKAAVVTFGSFEVQIIKMLKREWGYSVELSLYE